MIRDRQNVHVNAVYTHLYGGFGIWGRMVVVILANLLSHISDHSFQVVILQRVKVRSLP